MTNSTIRKQFDLYDDKASQKANVYGPAIFAAYLNMDMEGLDNLYSKAVLDLTRDEMNTFNDDLNFYITELVRQNPEEYKFLPQIKENLSRFLKEIQIARYFSDTILNFYERAQEAKRKAKETPNNGEENKAKSSVNQAKSTYSIAIGMIPQERLEEVLTERARKKNLEYKINDIISTVCDKHRINAINNLNERESETISSLLDDPNASGVALRRDNIRVDKTKICESKEDLGKYLLDR